MMPKTQIVLFQEKSGTVPFLDWFDCLPDKAKDQCRARLELLRDQGHELRRPAAENLGGGIYELRAKSRGVNYRMLYFFYGQRAVVLSHGFDKQRAAVPLAEIESARVRKMLYERNQEPHTYRGG
jgi:phage-related protein